MRTNIWTIVLSGFAGPDPRRMRCVFGVIWNNMYSYILAVFYQPSYCMYTYAGEGNIEKDSYMPADAVCARAVRVKAYERSESIH
jgi:hypothetical protein